MSASVAENATFVPAPVEAHHYHPPSSSSSSNSKKRKRVSRACVCCQRAHMSCDEGRPCKRCVERGMAHLCRDGQRKQRGRKRRGPRGSRVGDTDVDDDLARDEPDSKRLFSGSDDDGTMSPSDSEDDVDVVGDISSQDDDSFGLPAPRHPITSEWGMDCMSERSLTDSAEYSFMSVSEADAWLPLVHSFDPVMAQKALQSTFFDSHDMPFTKSEADRFFCVESALVSPLSVPGYQLLDCTF